MCLFSVLFFVFVFVFVFVLNVYKFVYFEFCVCVLLLCFLCTLPRTPFLFRLPDTTYLLTTHN